MRSYHFERQRDRFAIIRWAGSALLQVLHTLKPFRRGFLSAPISRYVLLCLFRLFVFYSAV